MDLSRIYLAVIVFVLIHRLIDRLGGMASNPLFIILQCVSQFYIPQSYVVKWPKEKEVCHFHDDATPLSFRLQVTEAFF